MTGPGPGDRATRRCSGQDPIAGRPTGPAMGQHDRVALGQLMGDLAPGRSVAHDQDRSSGDAARVPYVLADSCWTSAENPAASEGILGAW